jgi:pimeloyl-ACP methyl ester carboxylesterase
MENDPLAFVEADGGPLARELDRGWDRLGAELPALAVPTLAVHGSNDPIAPVGALRAYAEQIQPLSLVEITGGSHDIHPQRRHASPGGHGHSEVRARRPRRLS